MLRSTATRTLAKSLVKAPSLTISHRAASTYRNASPLQQLTTRRPQSPLLARPSIYLSFATKSGTPVDKIDSKSEKKIAETTIEAHPEAVSSESSIRHVFEGSEKKKDTEKVGSLQADIETIKETFALTEVPKESLYIGAAGVLPYAATSLSTVLLAVEIKHIHSTGTGYMFTADTAHQLLDWITPIQIGYGAVILSFLGAIHWGLEYAGYGGYHSYRRYMYGVIAPAVAWPTIFMPVEYALITQFTAFTFMYFADARATVRGWFPPWYSTYRFVLTFLVGASIVISLVGRGQIVSHDANLKRPADYIKEDRDTQWVALEREERERRRKLAEDEANEEEDDDEEEEEEGDESKGGNKDSKGDNKSDGEGRDKKGDKKGGEKGDGSDEKEDKEKKAKKQ